MIRNFALEKDLNDRAIEWTFDPESGCYEIELFGVIEIFQADSVPRDIRERIYRVRKLTKLEKTLR